MTDYDFSLDACYRSVEFHVEELNDNPFTLLGRYIVRAECDPLFNKTMIEAVKKYISDKGLEWNTPYQEIQKIVTGGNHESA